MLFAVWVWPLPHLGAPAFSAHMTMHMCVVALASPLIALGLAGGRWDPVRLAPAFFVAVPWSVLELIAVWSWHTPALHRAARTETWAFVAEQGTFFICGVLLWSSALGGSRQLRQSRAVGGVTGLLLTSIHMTLLGALLAVTPRLLYSHGHAQEGHGGATWGLTPLLDQQLGGGIMILFGGLAYLTGGLALVADLLRRRRGGEAG